MHNRGLYGDEDLSFLSMENLNMKVWCLHVWESNHRLLPEEYTDQKVGKPIPSVSANEVNIFSQLYNLQEKIVHT